MWAIEASPGPKVAYRGGGIILPPAILLNAIYRLVGIVSLFWAPVYICRSQILTSFNAAVRSPVLVRRANNVVPVAAL